MGRARVVAPPPQDYIPEPLVAPVIEIELEEEIVSWTDGNLQEEVLEIENIEPSQEELDREKIAQEKYEDLQRQKLFAEEETKVAAETIAKAKEIIENPPVVIETVVETIVETVHVTDPKLIEELDLLRAANEKLVRENEAAAKTKEEQIVKARQQATEQRSNQHMVQLNMTPKIPSLISKIKTVFRNRRIKSATNVGIKNYETAILERARIAVPKLLDDIEKMHEQLTILEDLLTKYSEVKSTQEK
jgi:hypothetical protein